MLYQIGIRLKIVEFSILKIRIIKLIVVVIVLILFIYYTDREPRVIRINYRILNPR